MLENKLVSGNTFGNHSLYIQQTENDHSFSIEQYETRLGMEHVVIGSYNYDGSDYTREKLPKWMIIA